MQNKPIIRKRIKNKVGLLIILNKSQSCILIPNLFKLYCLSLSFFFQIIGGQTTSQYRSQSIDYHSFFLALTRFQVHVLQPNITLRSMFYMNTARRFRSKTELDLHSKPPLKSPNDLKLPCDLPKYFNHIVIHIFVPRDN